MADSKSPRHYTLALALGSAFWNAPVNQADHACLACEATLECMKRIDQLNQRLDYTIMGDNVNLASRP